MTLGVFLHLSMMAYISPVFAAAVDLGVFAALMIAGYGLFVDRFPSFPMRPISGAWRWISEAGGRGATRHVAPADTSDERVADHI